MKNLKLLAFALLIGLFAGAQEKTDLNITLNHMALSVQDVDRSVAFYNVVLELKEITNRTKAEGIRWMSLGGDKELHLISVVKAPFSLNKAIHLGLSTTNFNGMIQRLDELKVPYSDWPGTPDTYTTRADGIKQVYFQDPDGYWIEVNNMGE